MINLIYKGSTEFFFFRVLFGTLYSTQAFFLMSVFLYKTGVFDKTAVVLAEKLLLINKSLIESL